MKIIVAADKFKGSLTAPQVCDAIERGVRRALPRAKIVKLPLADGGEGTVRALVAATGGKLATRQVTDPLGGKVRATFGVIDAGSTAVIEMASASGLMLVPDAKRDPLGATTYGTGELIRAALDLGVHKIIMGIGGSATNDGGAGMAMALGARLLDARGRSIGLGGGALARLQRIDLSAFRFPDAAVGVSVACDVTNPLCGPRGASAVYGPQKGATPHMVRILDRNLAHYARLVARDVTGRRRVMGSPSPLAAQSGAGAAGGLGFGLCAFLGANLQRGIELVLDHLDFEARLDGADLVITGEGAIDDQTLEGKVLLGVAARARKRGVSVLALGGSVPPAANKLFAHGIGGVMSLCHSPMSLAQAIQGAPGLLELAAERAMRIVVLGRDC
jgi:glycerate 2-kinase